ncbi:hypothetical protein [uncultured Gimesia sp.]|uniref:hypothetical protein n=1 Tax=uncultured Gimesia sp. TaxID=1678688 RepID=UPI0030DC6605|tara:strand:- start:54876 stop:55898 length:1023 start_codon:yes stop_codon:yes gene_type:complete
MSSSLYISSTCLRVLQNDSNHKLTRRSIETAYTVLDDTHENRQLLQKIAVPFLFSEGTLIIPGENAGQIARFSHSPLYPLFTKGELGLNDPVHRQLLSTLIQSVLPKARRTGEYCSFITPGTDPAGPLSKLVSQLITLQGFTPFATTITQSAGLAALPASLHYSGYIVYLGHSHSEIGLIHQSRVVVRHAAPYGSEWLDEQLAYAFKFFTTDSEGETVPDSAKARTKRLNPEINLSPYLSNHSLLTNWYESLFDSLLDEFASKMDSMQNYIETLETLPVVYMGELSHIDGFDELLAQSLSSRKIRFDTGQVMLKEDEHFTITRGALVMAAMEDETLSRAA